jgi:uncharacterized damage-inducible protein DinB
VPSKDSIPPGLWAGSLWELEDTRRRTLEVIADVDSATIDEIPPGFDNSIGALLHHIALIEADWLYADILVADYPDWMFEAFPDEDRDENGHLVPAPRPLPVHLATLAMVRDNLLESLQALPDSEFTRVRATGSGDLTPQWVLHHLRQHEAEHRGQIQSLVTALRT